PSLVLPTTHTMVALSSSRYIEYSDVPGGVFSTHGFCCVPSPTTLSLTRFTSRLYALVPGRWPAEDAFSATAARMSAFNAFSSIFSPSWKSMARLVLPSRLELKRPEGSSNEAPLAKVIFTTFLYVSPVQIIPACDHTGTPLHFHSSTTSGSACLMRTRTRASVSPRQSPSSLILASISSEGESPAF